MKNKELTDQLIEYVKEENENKIVMSREKEGADINAISTHGFTPLSAAVIGGHIDTVKLLLDLGDKADIQDKHGTGAYPLHHAAFSGKTEIIEILLNNGADINSVDFNGCTPLYFAVSNKKVDAVKMLLMAGADINAEDSSGDTPLNKATNNDNLEILSIMNFANNIDNIFNKPDLVKLGHIKIDASNQEIFTNRLCGLLKEKSVDELEPLIVSLQENISSNVNIEGDFTKVVNKILAKLLHCKVSSNDINSVKYLLDKGIDVDIEDEDGATPLFVACRDGYIDVAKMLIRAGADVNQQDTCGMSLLYNAFVNGNEEIVGLLMKFEADINNNGAGKLQNIFSSMVHTFYKAMDEEKYLRLIDILIEKSDINQVSNKQLPLLYVLLSMIQQYNDSKKDLFLNILYKLLEKRSDVNVNVSVNTNIDVDKLKAKPGSPLYIACIINDEKLIKMLVERGAKLKENGNSLLLEEQKQLYDAILNKYKKECKEKKALEQDKANLESNLQLLKKSLHDIFSDENSECSSQSEGVRDKKYKKNTNIDIAKLYNKIKECTLENKESTILDVLSDLDAKILDGIKKIVQEIDAKIDLTDKVNEQLVVFFEKIQSSFEGVNSNNKIAFYTKILLIKAFKDINKIPNEIGIKGLNQTVNSLLKLQKDVELTDEQISIILQNYSRNVILKNLSDSNINIQNLSSELLEIIFSHDNYESFKTLLTDSIISKCTINNISGLISNLDEDSAQIISELTDKQISIFLNLIEKKLPIEEIKFIFNLPGSLKNIILDNLDLDKDILKKLTSLQEDVDPELVKFILSNTNTANWFKIGGNEFITKLDVLFKDDQPQIKELLSIKDISIIPFQDIVKMIKISSHAGLIKLFKATKLLNCTKEKKCSAEDIVDLIKDNKIEQIIEFFANKHLVSTIENGILKIEYIKKCFEESKPNILKNIVAIYTNIDTYCNKNKTDEGQIEGLKGLQKLTGQQKNIIFGEGFIFELLSNHKMSLLSALSIAKELEVTDPKRQKLTKEEFKDLNNFYMTTFCSDNSSGSEESSGHEDKIPVSSKEIALYLLHYYSSKHIGYQGYIAKELESIIRGKKDIESIELRYLDNLHKNFSNQISIRSNAKLKDILIDGTANDDTESSDSKEKSTESSEEEVKYFQCSGKYKEKDISAEFIQITDKLYARIHKNVVSDSYTLALELAAKYGNTLSPHSLGKSGIKSYKTPKGNFVYKLKVKGSDEGLLASVLADEKDNKFIIFSKEKNHKEFAKYIQGSEVIFDGVIEDSKIIDLNAETSNSDDDHDSVTSVIDAPDYTDANEVSLVGDSSGSLDDNNSQDSGSDFG